MTRKAVFHDAGAFDDGAPIDLSAASGLDAHIADTTDAQAKALTRQIDALIRIVGGQLDSTSGT